MTLRVSPSTHPETIPLRVDVRREEEILISGERDDRWFGRTRNFKEVFFAKTSDDTKIGDIVKVKIEKIDRWVLRGERI